MYANVHCRIAYSQGYMHICQYRVNPIAYSQGYMNIFQCPFQDRLFTGVYACMLMSIAGSPIHRGRCMYVNMG